MFGSFLTNFAAGQGTTQGAADTGTTIFFWVLVLMMTMCGILGPILTRKKFKSIVAYVTGWIMWFFFAVLVSQFVLAFAQVVLSYSVDKATLKGTTFTTLFEVLMYFIMFAVMVWLPLRRWKREQLSKLSVSKKGQKSTTKPARAGQTTATIAQTGQPDSRRFILKTAGLSHVPTWNDVKNFLTMFPLYFVTLYAASLIFTLVIAMFWGGDVARQVMGQTLNIGFSATGNSPLALVLIGFCLIFLAPLFEEMLVRGALFGKLRARLKFWPAALLTAIVFAAIHGQFNVGIMTFILALFAGYLREKTGAVWSGMMLHATQNLIAFCLLFFR